MKIKNLVEAQEYLNQYIAQGGYKYPGDTGIKRTRYFLKLLDNPQNKLKVIHIAGTSGKGSTAYYISTILYALGKKVGLHVSPHLVDLRERFQINNELINEREFCEYLEEVVPYIEKVDELNLGKITYFEVCIGLVYYIFYQKKVDYAVIETGLGGLFDATNVVDSEDKISVITKIGFDHTEILGNTLKKIAFQKAGIIQNGNTVVTIEQDIEAMEIIKKESKKKQSMLFVIPDQIGDLFNIDSRFRGNDKSSSQDDKLMSFHFKFLNQSLNIALNELAEYQIENCTLALAVVTYLSQRDHFDFNKELVQKTLLEAHFKGRMDVILLKELDSATPAFSQASHVAPFGSPSAVVAPSSLTSDTKGKILVIDGAHNPQKMEAFTKSLMRHYPNKTFTFLLAMKSGKDYYDTIKYILPLAKEIIVTGFNIKTQQGMSGVVSEKPEKLQSILNEMGYTNTQIIPDVKNAYQALIDEQGIVVVTGSLYLVSEVYKILNSK